MLRKGEQCSPTDVCHVHDINVRTYTYAWNGCTARQACQIWQAFFVLFAD